MKLSRLAPSALLLIAVTLSGEQVLAQRGNPIARLIRAQQVEVKSSGQANYAAATSGQALYYGDLVRVRRGGRGVIQCSADSTEWVIPDDELPRGVANTCP